MVDQLLMVLSYTQVIPPAFTYFAGALLRPVLPTQQWLLTIFLSYSRHLSLRSAVFRPQTVLVWYGDVLRCSQQHFHF